jgi:hypothetical protein
MFTPELADALELAAADVLELAALLAGVLLAGALLLELLELLDEHAASSTAAPVASTPKATRVARGFRLPILKRSMRPRICHPGSTGPRCPQTGSGTDHRLDLESQDCQQDH